MGHGEYRITEHNASRFTDDEIAVGTAFGNAIAAEILPDHPPEPVETAIAASRARPARVRRFSFRAWAPDGSLVGSTGVGFDPEHDDNPDVLESNISVAREHRGHGVASLLLAHLVALAHQEGRTRLLGWTTAEVPAGEAFAQAAGAEPKLSMHMNHLPTAEVDRATLQQWLTDGPARAAGYELVAWDGSVPDEHLEPFVELYHVMNNAPRDDLALNDFTLSPREWREHETVMAAAKIELWILAARRVSDGALAGLHSVSWSPDDPAVVWVQDTGVRPEHRGHALGKWLKAAMQLRILDERPHVTDVRTGNADSNDAMLGINRAMGYRPMLSTTTWELPVDSAERWLKQRVIIVPDRITVTI